LNGFAALDWLVVAAYFAAVLAVAAWAARRDRAEKASAATEDYFLAGRNVGWFVVGASVFASNIGSEHLVGLAGSGAATGLAVAQFEIIAGLALLLLGWLFVPFYLSSGVFTMPEFLERRYSAGPRTYLATISIIAYVLTKISVTIAAGGIVFETLMGIEFWTGAAATVVLTGLYTLWGGLRAVLWTDAVQTVVMLTGSALLVFIGLATVGGWEAMVASVPEGTMSLWRPANHPDFPWTGILLGAPILAIWYWCTDQFIVQRTLSARSVADARKAVIFAGYLKQLPMFLFVLPGVIAMALVQQGALDLPRTDGALPALIGLLLPVGLKGLMGAALLAALMSSLSSVFNSVATLLTVDIYARLKPDASERAKVTFGRAGVAVMVLLGLAWIPLINVISGGIYTYLQSVQAYLAPPIAAVFLLGVLWRRANSQGAIATLAVGFVIGMGRLVLEAGQVDAGLFTSVNFLHFAFILFCISVVVLVIVSLATAPPPPEKVDRLTVGSLTPEVEAEVAEDRSRDLALSAGLLLLIAILWVVFA
jgi:SSS family solute:Na+ symporter